MENIMRYTVCLDAENNMKVIKTLPNKHPKIPDGWRKCGNSFLGKDEPVKDNYFIQEDYNAS